jgi:hypothetical protein
MANHDGSLYLIKPLDCDTNTSIRFFNLTVLVTNWLGQNDLVSIEVNVRDVNDNRPRFIDSQIHLNQTVHIGEQTSDHALIDLTTAHDLDNIDRGKLEFKIENCFYLGKTGLLIKKNADSYPLCGKQYIDLITSSQLMNANYAKNSQLVRLKLKTREIKSFLSNSSNFFFNCDDQQGCLVSFVLDISVKDTSMVSSSIVRVFLDLILVLNEPTKTTKVFKRDYYPEMMNIFRQKPGKAIQAGFKRDAYNVFIRNLEQMKSGAHMIRLNDEFVWLEDDTNNFNSFQPYELEFSILSDNQFFSIDKNFGLLYLNRSLFELDLFNNLEDSFVFKVEIECRLLSTTTQKFTINNPLSANLFPTTHVVFSISKTVLLDEIFSQSSLISNIPVWRSSSVDVFVRENSPAGSNIFTNADSRLEHVLKIEDFIDMASIDRVKRLILLEPNDLFLSFSLAEQSELFSIEPNTGYLRILFEPDYENVRLYGLKVQLCFTSTSTGLLKLDPNTICFKQLLNLNVNVLNVNDNEPKLKPINAFYGYEKNLNLSSSNHELIQTMSLFKFTVSDLDELDTLSYELVNVALIPRSNVIDNATHTFANTNNEYRSSKCPNLNAEINWFELFELSADSSKLDLCIQLTSVGYENLHLLEKIASTDEANCFYRIEVVVKITDGLFTSKIPFNLNIHHMIKKSLNEKSKIPLLQTLVIDSLKPEAGVLLNLDKALVNFIGIKTSSNDNSILNLVSFQLINYENFFEIDAASNLVLLTSNLSDSRSNYELIIKLKPRSSVTRNDRVPQIARIVFKFTFLIPRPEFVFPFEIKHTKEVHSQFDQYYLNKTYLLNKLLESTDPVTSPFMQIGAVNNGDYDNHTFRMDFSIASCSVRNLFRIHELTGQLYMNPTFDQNSFSAKDGDKIVDLRVKVENLIIDESKTVEKFQSVSFLNMRFTLVNRIDIPLDREVYFKQTYFVFRIYESVGKIFNYSFMII